MNETSAEIQAGISRRPLKERTRVKLREIKAFSEAPNTEAELLEEALGISFGETKPAKIILDWPNILRIVFREKGLARKILQLSSYIKDTRETLGKYFPGYNTICLYPGLSESEQILYSLHENMEAWSMRQNPEFPVNSYAEICDLLKGKGMTKEEFSKEAERLVLLDITREGLAEWGAIQTGLRTSRLDDREFVRRHNRLSDTEFVQTSLSMVDLALLDFELAHEFYQQKDTKPKSIAFSLLASDLLEVSRYPAGYAAVASLMKRHEEADLSTSEALCKIATNPLTSFLELKAEIDEFLESGRAE